MYYDESGIKIVFRFGRYEYSCECYSLRDVVAFIDDLSTDFMEDGQLRVYMFGAKKEVSATMYTEDCKRVRNGLPELVVSESERFHIEDEDT